MDVDPEHVDEHPVEDNEAVVPVNPDDVDEDAATRAQEYDGESEGAEYEDIDLDQYEESFM
jgi:hypothetical protein